MADPTPPTDGTTPPPPPSAGSALAVPDETAARFPEFIVLIKGSESMNDEERQYWINILPIMTPDQLQNLKEILENEKRQLQAIDEKYARQAGTGNQTVSVQAIEEERRKKRFSRQDQESSHKKEEEQETEHLLREIEGQG